MNVYSGDEFKYYELQGFNKYDLLAPVAVTAATTDTIMIDNTILQPIDVTYLSGGTIRLNRVGYFSVSLICEVDAITVSSGPSLVLETSDERDNTVLAKSISRSTTSTISFSGFFMVDDCIRMDFTNNSPEPINILSSNLIISKFY